jgi:hypothetical protein
LSLSFAPQIQEVPAGKIKTYKAVKEGPARSVVIDRTGHIADVGDS